MHRKARTHTVLIADTGPRSYADNATPTHPTDAAARVDRVLSRIPRYAGTGGRSSTLCVLPLESCQHRRFGH
eukprot:4395734-Pleurochrysis_carterae.AAC.1